MGFFSKFNDKRKKAMDDVNKNKSTLTFIFKVLCKDCKKQVLKYMRHKDYNRFVDNMCDVCRNHPDLDLGLEGEEK